MEIYRNSEAQVTIPSPTVTGGTHTITVTSPDGSTSTPSFTLNTTNGTVTFLLDFKHTLYDGRVKIEDTITRPAPTVEDPSATESFVVTEYIDVVTPLFTWQDLDGSYPRDDVPELENLVRMVIEAFTGQHFGRRIETHLVNTNGVNYFQVPIIEYTGISARYMTNTTTLNPPKLSYEFVDSNFGLKITSSEYYDVKTDSLWILGKRVPVGHLWIDGVFGYDRVPADVKRAALLIAGLWGCEQTVWRDRFIQTMRSSDWSIQYNDGAFGKSTGSQTADNLLAKYAGQGIMPEVI